MKVYFTASTTSPNNRYKKQYQNILSLLRQKHQLISGPQIISPQKLLADQKLGWEKVFARENKLVAESDCVVAEVTSPSTGVGGIIVHALTLGKPVLALFYEEAEDKLSPMVAGNPAESLYLEHYDDDNLEIVLKHFTDHVESGQKRQGHLIVLDGGDGSGKATQGKLLIKYLQKKGRQVRYYDFPRYYSSFHGRLVGRFLNGEFGKLDEVSPYLASLAYALDRASVKEEMNHWLAKGGDIICNRYVTSSMAHQGAKLPRQDRDKFFEWVDELEYRQHKMPRPDLVIYLYVPWQIGRELTAKKVGTRAYTKGQDIAEKDLRHRQDAEETYLSLAGKRKKWLVLNCLSEDKKMNSVDVIQKQIQAILEMKGLINHYDK